MRVHKTKLFLSVTGIAMLLFSSVALVLAQSSNQTPDFTIFVNCVSPNADGATYTGHFGYSNNNNNTENLDESFYTPSLGGQSPPRNLHSGTDNDAFIMTFPKNDAITWVASVGDYRKTATISSANRLCPGSAVTPDPAEAKITICHAAGLAGTTQFVTLTISHNAVYGNGGHFNENGTPQAGHEDDYFGPCLQPTATPAPTPAVTTQGTQTPTPSATETTTPSTTIGAQITQSPTTTPTSTPTGTLTATPTETTPATGTPTGTNTVTESPTGSVTPTNIVPTPTLLPTELPVEQVPATVLAQKVILKPSQQEVVNFNESTWNIKSICPESEISLSFLNVNGTNALQLFEYSLDGGTTWFPVPSNQVKYTKDHEVYTVNIVTAPKAEKPYAVRLRVQTSNGRVFTSNTVPFVLQCGQQPIITSIFYRNGFLQSFISGEGSDVINPNLPVKLFVETAGGIDTITATINGNKQIVNFTYNYIEDVWETDIPLDKSISQYNIEITASARDQQITKVIPPLVYPESVLGANTTNSQKANDVQSYEYEVFYIVDQTWQPFDYNAVIGSIPTVKNGFFTLPSGTYFIRVTSLDGVKQITETFTLTQPSIVQVNTDARSNNIITQFLPMFFMLPVKVINATALQQASTGPQQDRLGNSEKLIVENLVKNQTIDADRPFVVMYWNRWIPYFDEQLSLLEKLSKDKNVKVVFVTNKANIEELKSRLIARESKLPSYEIPDSLFADRTFLVLPAVSVYKSESEHSKTLWGVQSYDNLSNLIGSL